MKAIVLYLFICFYFASCNNSDSFEKNVNVNPDSCFTLYKIIVRPDSSIADSIFVNCTNDSFFFHKKISKEGKLESTGYILNRQLHGTYTVYEDDGTTISCKATYKNGNKIDDETHTN